MQVSVEAVYLLILQLASWLNSIPVRDLRVMFLDKTICSQGASPHPGGSTNDIN